MRVHGGIGPRRKICSGLALTAIIIAIIIEKKMLRQMGKFFRSQSMRFFSVSVPSENEIPQDVLIRREKDMPVALDKNPFEKEKPKCILCKYDVKLDYKNVRLLSQFVSSFSGKVYDRHITGICERQQKLLLKAVKKARGCGLMPYYHKDLVYMRDPQLFDPEQPFRPHKY